MKKLLLCTALAVAAVPAVAQSQVNSAIPPAPVVAAPVANATLRAGTPIALRFMEEVTTKDKQARIGQRVRMEVSSPIIIDGVTVIPAGSPAEGEITGVRNKGMWGKSGRLEGRALFVRVNGRQIRLAGAFNDRGVTGTAGVVGAVAVVPIVGFFVTGTSATFPMGGEVGVFIDEDVPLAFATSQPAPIQVQTNAPLAVGGNAVG